ncbi:tyrosine-type recombinase/integrase [Halomicrococcus sp. SG-WS-1]|uniref:tyrosine-type recombinase/integrase n=1 Tax=Halomicrococcus sp. SG-WS-1 TaxID=3439057 RepID=UPI003F7AE575
MTRSMKPSRAVDRYLKERKPEVSNSTYQNHKYALKQFLEWCESEDVDDISVLDNFHIHDFKIYRREECGINEVTLYNNLCTLRVFIRWMESMGVVDGDIAENMILPNPDDDARSEKIDADRANTILDYLDKFEYATMRHALFALLWDTGFRLGTAQAIDVGDYDSSTQTVAVRHRPEKGTPLKNKKNAERKITLHPWVCDVLDDYLQMHRHDVEDDFGRQPFFTTKYGRPAKTTLRKNVKWLTRPCHYTDGCPHSRERNDCEAAQHWEKTAQCPSVVSPHSIRRSAITHWLNEAQNKEHLSQRMDVSTKTMDKHYDARTEEEKRQRRQESFGIDIRK